LEFLRSAVAEFKDDKRLAEMLADIVQTTTPF
jgi:hypothetical protein